MSVPSACSPLVLFKKRFQVCLGPTSSHSCISYVSYVYVLPHHLHCINGQTLQNDKSKFGSVVIIILNYEMF